MTQLKQFQQIVDILHTDYAGYIDKKGWDNPEKYLDILQNTQLSQAEFIEVIESYLASFRDAHVFIHEKGRKPEFLPFRTRCFENCLYVTASQDSAFPVGAKITKVDDQSIEEISEYSSILLDPVLERQVWTPILQKALTAEVDGVTQKISLVSQLTLHEPAFEMKWLTSSTFYIALPHFQQDEPLQSLVDKYQEDLKKAENLILDVRKNSGGSDSVYFPLLPYLFPEDCTSSELLPMAKEMLLLLTERNCDQRLAYFKEQLQDPQIGKDSKQMIQQFIHFYSDHYGKGFVSFNEFSSEESSEISKEPTIKSLGFSKPIYVLTDWECGSSGESFVLTLSGLENVTVVGRHTHGTWDYSNLSWTDFETFTLYYGTSKIVYQEGFESIEQVGITPDIHIPWTPEMLKEDVDLNVVLSLIHD